MQELLKGPKKLLPGIAGLQVIKSILNVAQLLLAEFKRPHEHHLQPYRNTQHEIYYEMKTYRTPWTLLYQPPRTPKVAARPATWHWCQGSKIVWSMENTKVDEYQSPPPTPFSSVKWSEVEGNLSCPLKVGDLGLFYWGMKGNGRTLEGSMVFVSLNLLFSTNLEKSKTHNFCFLVLMQIPAGRR